MRPNNPEDVWGKVSIASNSECWNWTGGTFSGRYGRFAFRGESFLAHRFVYEVVNGAGSASGLLVMHKCNNKLCCNPEHLTLGTNSKNQMHAGNSGARAVGISGRRGVWFDKKRRYWIAGAYLEGKKFNLYTGPSLDKAISARERWESVNDVSFKLE